MLNTIITIVPCVMLAKRGIISNPSMADVTEMGGVIIPSANNAAPPIMAGKPTIVFVFLPVQIPPSPLLSALRVRTTYLMVV